MRFSQLVSAIPLLNIFLFFYFPRILHHIHQVLPLHFLFFASSLLFPPFPLAWDSTNKKKKTQKTYEIDTGLDGLDLVYHLSTIYL